MSEKFDLMARFTANAVTEIIAHRYAMPLNKAISLFSKSRVFELLINSKTELWIDNPSDIADMFDMETNGDPIDPAYYFK